jgi:hypothetical protein
MPYGYAGGPVVAEAMKDLYAVDSFNYPDGYPLALLAATVGMFVGVIAGAVLVNLAPLGIGLGGAADTAGGHAGRGRGATGGAVGSPIPAQRPRGTLIRRLKKSMKDLAATAPDSDQISATVRSAAHPFHSPAAPPRQPVLLPCRPSTQFPSHSFPRKDLAATAPDSDQISATVRTTP